MICPQPDCCGKLDTRNQLVAFCSVCAGYVDMVTGAAYKRNGVFVMNVNSRDYLHLVEISEPPGE